MNEIEEPVKKHILEVTSLTKVYGKRQVVGNINLSVNTGEIVGLLGPNGAGKTTTFYMIVGLIRPDGGDITLDGRDLSSMPMYIRARNGIGYLPQEPSIFRKLTVRQNLEAVLEIAGFEGAPRNRSDIKHEVEKLLTEFNLVEFADRDGFRLSGGERRRTEIARAIAVRPTFMLFDEPFAGIDPLAIIELKKMLLYLRAKGLGILITDHNVRETLSITDRAYIISNGAVLAEGSADDLVNNAEVKEAYLGEEFRL
jgi:lipopolysaccharide export system ATP-binding protein